MIETLELSGKDKSIKAVKGSDAGGGVRERVGHRDFLGSGVSCVALSRWVRLSKRVVRSGPHAPVGFG